MGYSNGSSSSNGSSHQDFLLKKGGGGNDNIILNPQFDDGSNNWTGRGCSMVLHEFIGPQDGSGSSVLPRTGKRFAAATGRSQTWNGIQQDITGRVQAKRVYEVTAIVRLFGTAISPSDVFATLFLQSGQRQQYIRIGRVQATDKDWSMLEGRIFLNDVGDQVTVFVEGPPPGVDLLLNSFIMKRPPTAPPSPPPNFDNVVYGANILQNSDLGDALTGWIPMGSCALSDIPDGAPRLLPTMATVSSAQLPNGRYILATNRTQTFEGPSQTVTDKIVVYATYQVSGWVRAGAQMTTPQNVYVTVSIDGQRVTAGQVSIKDSRWYEMAGSFRIETQPSNVVVYVEGPDAGVDLMVAGLQVFPVDRKARFKHLKAQTDKVRKRDVVLKISGPDGAILQGASVQIRQTANSFPFGTCILRTDIDNDDFVNFFLKHFNWAVFGNELKWYWTEPQQGRLNYADADDLLALCDRNGIPVRGHCIFWEVENTVQQWIRNLSTADLMTAVSDRLTGLLTRYKGRFPHYDVNNEMLHGSFYQDRLGDSIRAFMFKTASQLDPEATLFVNDYNVESFRDGKATPETYIEQVLGLQGQGVNVGGVGLQGHVTSPVGALVSATVDRLAVLGLPVWFTELDVTSSNEHVRADDLEVMLREAFAHPAVSGVMLWGFWEVSMWRDKAFLVDAEGEPNEAGKRLMELKKEWLTHAKGQVDESGEFRFRGFAGKYILEIDTIVKAKKYTSTFTVKADAAASPVVINVIDNVVEAQ